MAVRKPRASMADTATTSLCVTLATPDVVMS